MDQDILGPRTSDQDQRPHGEMTAEGLREPRVARRTQELESHDQKPFVGKRDGGQTGLKPKSEDPTMAPKERI